MCQRVGAARPAAELHPLSGNYSARKTMVPNSDSKASWSRVAYCFGIGLCIQGGIWVFWHHPSSRLAALVALLLLGIGIIVTHRGAPVRFIMVSLHLELQAACLGLVLGHQLFDVYPASPIWFSALSNVITGIVAAVVLGFLGTVGLGVTRWVAHSVGQPSGQQRAASDGVRS